MGVFAFEITKVAKISESISIFILKRDKFLPREVLIPTMRGCDSYLAR